jgi:hypothetical protein
MKHAPRFWAHSVSVSAIVWSRQEQGTSTEKASSQVATCGQQATNTLDAADSGHRAVKERIPRTGQEGQVKEDYQDQWVGPPA